MRYAYIEQKERDDDNHADTYPLLFESVYDIGIEQYIHDAIQLAGSQCQNWQKASAEYRDNPIADVLSSIGKSSHSFVSESLKRRR